MRFGDEIEVLPDGLIISAKSLEPLGIEDGSTCWGYWVRGRPPRNSQKRPSTPPHLIISSIHPESWCTSFNLHLLLRDAPGTLYQFCEAVTGKGVNILTAQASFAGYDHTVMNATCDFVAMRNWREEFISLVDKDLRKSKKNSGKKVGFIENWTRHLETEMRREKRNFKAAKCVTPGTLLDQVRTALHVTPLPVNRSTELWESHLHELIRRYAIEFLGRQMLARLTLLWVSIRIKEYELYDKAVSKSGKKKKIDPDGDYFFTSKVIQTGRRPWNLQLPFPASWEMPIDYWSVPYDKKSREPDLNRLNQFFEEQEGQYDKLPGILGDFFARSPGGSKKERQFKKDLDQLFESILKTEDKEWKERTGFLRYSREAFLAWEQKLKGKNGKKEKARFRWVHTIVERILRHHWLMPVTSQALYELAYSSIWRYPIEPIEFKYDAGKTQLTTQENGISDSLRAVSQQFGELDKKYVKNNPRFAIASFNVDERFVRLNFIPDKAAKRIVRAVVKYHLARPSSDEDQSGFEGPDDADTDKISEPIPEPTTQGLLKALCAVCFDRRMNLLRVRNRVEARFSLDDNRDVLERGTIIIIAKREKEFDDDSNERLEADLNNVMKTASTMVPFREQIKVKARVSPYETTSLFLSTVFGHSREDELRSIVQSSAGKFGFKTIDVKNKLRPTTDEIRHSIDSVDAVLQIVCLREEDKSRAVEPGLWYPEYTWLHTEYAIATTLGKPTIRIIDNSMPGHVQELFQKVDRDKVCESIDLRSSPDDLERIISEAVRELRSSVTGKTSIY